MDIVKWKCRTSTNFYLIFLNKLSPNVRKTEYISFHKQPNKDQTQFLLPTFDINNDFKGNIKQNSLMK